MPPKTEVALSASQIVAIERESRTYSDYPECLPRYRDLVKEALKEASKLFNSPPPHYCKACGLPMPRQEWRNHALDHAAELNLSASTPLTMAPEPVFREMATEDGPVFDTVPAKRNPRVASPLWDDINSIVQDTLDVKLEGLDFKDAIGALVGEISSAIDSVAVDEAVQPFASFCDDCAQ